jgi:hypothetical protein
VVAPWRAPGECQGHGPEGLVIRWARTARATTFRQWVLVKRAVRAAPQKPFTSEQLARKLREVLDTPGLRRSVF